LKINSNKQVFDHSYRKVNTEERYFKINPSKTFTLEGARAQYIKKSYQGFLEKPLLGHGLTTFRKNHNIFDDKGKLIRKPVTHNDYLQILYELGLVGLLLFLYLFIFNFRKIYKYTSLNSSESVVIFIQLVTLAISLNSGNYLDHALFWMIMGLTLSKTEQFQN
jgi:O-antigen ligase